MSLGIPAGEKPGPGLHVVLTGLARQARRDAERIDSDPERRTHAIRTGMKKFRALLRLAKHHVDRDERGKLRGLIAEMKGGLSTARDRVVVAGIAEDVLGKESASKGGKPGPSVEGGALADVSKALEERTRNLDLSGLGRDALRKRWQRARRRTRDAEKCARKSGAAKDFHRWRKGVKDLWYQSEALRGMFAAAGKMVKPAKKLGGILGKEHDLTVAMESLDNLSKSDRNALEKQREKRRREAFAAAKGL